jgi:hypothetical protein
MRPNTLTAELALTPNRSAAARRDEPACTAATTRLRKSIESDFTMATPPATVNQITPASVQPIQSSGAML